MNTRQLAALAAMLGTGAVTAEAIRDTYGDGILTSVLGMGAGAVTGSVAAAVTSPVLGVIERHTGLVSVADDLLDFVNPFRW